MDMPPVLPRIVVSMTPEAQEALAFLMQRYGLTQAAMVRLAVRRMAEAEGFQVGETAA